MKFKIYRFDPDKDNKPYLQDYELSSDKFDSGTMLLEALNQIKAQDPSLSFRRSCREGVCGSDALNVNGRNLLGCITLLSSLKEPIVIRPLPGQPVIRDLIVDMSNFYEHYKEVKPYLINDEAPPKQERLQSPEQRAQLDGLYECILCGCCTTFCPSFWWNPDKFKGPAALLQAARFIFDSRDDRTDERLESLEETFGIFRCRTILNCTSVCPKGLDPSKAIGNIRSAMLKRSVGK